MSEQIIGPSIHTKFHDVHVHEDGTKTIRDVFHANTSEDVLLDSADLTKIVSKLVNPTYPSGTNYVLKDVIKNLGKIAFNEDIKVSDFAPGVVTDRTDSEDPDQIASAKAVRDIRMHLFNINNGDSSGAINIFAPQTPGTGVPSYDQTTKTWTWVPITGTKKILGNKIILNDNEVTTNKDIRIYSPQGASSYDATYAPIIVFNGQGKAPLWKPITSVLKLNGGGATKIGSGVYAPTTSGQAGEVLVSRGPNKEPQWESQSQTSFYINGRKMVDHAYQQYIIGRYDTNHNVIFTDTLFWTTWEDKSTSDGLESYIYKEEPDIEKGWFICDFNESIEEPMSFSELINNEICQIPDKKRFYQVCGSNRVYVKVAWSDIGNGNIERKYIEYDKTPMDDDMIYVFPCDINITGDTSCVLNFDYNISSQWAPIIRTGSGAFSGMITDVAEEVSHLSFVEVKEKTKTTAFVVFQGVYEDSSLNAPWPRPFSFAEYNGETYNGQEYSSSKLSFYAPESPGQKGNILVSGGSDKSPEWKEMQFNPDGTVAIEMDSIPTPNSRKAVTSGGVYDAINDAILKVNGRTTTLKSMQSQNIVTPSVMGTSGQQLVSQGTNPPVWQNRGSYFVSGYIGAGYTNGVVSITVPKILATDKICVKSGIDSLHSTFSASRMDDYADAGAYIKSVNAPTGSTSVTVAIYLRNRISYAFPFNIEVIFS